MNTLILRCLPDDEAAVRAEVQQLLKSQREPGAIVCRGTPLADLVTAAAD